MLMGFTGGRRREFAVGLAKVSSNGGGACSGRPPVY
jgi:hypothetical protein